ncbi:UNKNOWN [Stylonychia lemnae]|uniref:FUZ/MON1/HPS1 first Longin domain-containing protein n=1 Tax=Stylonychia lemnae TaxID=5949 RepID=A0A078AZX6_STYLE|nr:UNKNOWN [Stylonychia lemnae]|eukprot:CDW87641.1 UNKNOWN [Stylonychia lemnae]
MDQKEDNNIIIEEEEKFGTAEGTTQSTLEHQNFEFEAEHSFDNLFNEAQKDRGQEKRRGSSFKGTSFEKMTRTEEDEKELHAFFSNQRLYMVFTNAGKPVYSSYGDIYQLSPIIATLYAILSKVHTFEFPEYENPLKTLVVGSNNNDSDALNQSHSKISNRLSMAFKSMIEKKDINRNTIVQEEVKKERTGFENEQDKVFVTKIVQIATLSRNFKVAFLHKGQSLIYIALSRDQFESVSFMKKQLEVLHTQFISLQTSNLIKTLNINQSYDVANELYQHQFQIKHLCDKMYKDPYTFLNQFLPLRLHPKTRELVDETLRNNKPQTDKYYFGLVLMEGTVVGVIKNEMKITVVPTDINMIMNYINTNLHNLRTKTPSFETICLPGLTEEYKLNLFVHLEKDSPFKVIFASDENGEDLMQEFERASNMIIKEFGDLEIIDILLVCESKMAERINLKEVQNTIISNQNLEQFTVYNYPISDLQQINYNQLRSIQEYEQLYERYQAFNPKKDFFAKKVYAIDTYAILSQGDYCVMATISHNRTEKDVKEICQNILDDARLDEGSSFIPKWF